MESLKTLNTEYANLMEAIETSINSETGEIPSELIASLENLQMKREEKIQNHIRLRIIKNSRIKAIKEEITRLQKMQKREENFIQWQDEYLDHEIGEDERFECADGVVGHRTSQAVKITNEEILPIQYLIPKVQVDKAQMLKDLKEGKRIAGAELETRKKVYVK